MVSNSGANILEKTLEVVAKEEDLKEVAIVIEKAENGGYLSSSSLAKLEGTNAKGELVQLNMFIKHVPKHEGMREETVVVAAYHREIYLYTRILPMLLQFQEEKGVTFPFRGVTKCYKTCAMERSEFVILEDLNKRGFSMWDKTKPMSDECVRLILREYGKFHALSLAFKDQRPKSYNRLTEKITDDIFENLLKDNMEIVKGNFRAAISCFDTEKENSIIQSIEKFISENIEAALTHRKGCKETVIMHGDCWCNNFMILFDDARKPLEVKFLDWQLSTVSSPAIDLAYFIYTNTSGEVFNNIHHYLNVYHDSLSFNLKELGSDPDRIYPMSALERDWKRYARFGIALGGSALKLYYSHSSIPDLAEDAAGRDFINRLPDDNTFFNDPMYKQRVRDLLLHAMEAGLLDEC